MRLLGIDYGLKNTGLALGVSGGATLPLKSIRTSDVKTIIKEVKEICSQEHIDKIIVGIPEYYKKAQKKYTLSFVKELKRNIKNIPVVLINEYGTSKEAFDEEFIKFSKIKKTKKILHSRSAEKIIENYLAYLGEDTLDK